MTARQHPSLPPTAVPIATDRPNTYVNVQELDGAASGETDVGVHGSASMPSTAGPPRASPSRASAYEDMSGRSAPNLPPGGDLYESMAETMDAFGRSGRASAQGRPAMSIPSSTDGDVYEEVAQSLPPDPQSS